MMPPKCNCDDSFENGACEVHGVIGKKEYDRLQETDPLNFCKTATVSDSPELTGYDDLSGEAKETLKGMVEYCINHEYCMGMDGGYDENDAKREFRVQLEQFCAS